MSSKIYGFVIVTMGLEICKIPVCPNQPCFALYLALYPPHR